jgi:uncharacterized membrane protein YdjX (TVP38/TMEM64 family)
MVFNPQELLQNSLEWIQGLGAAGAIAFIALYAVATTVFVPAALLTLGAGVVFGVIQGAIYVFVGACLGATLAFLMGRYLVRDKVAKKFAENAKFKAIDQAIAREGFKIVVLTRLSPIFPFTLLNYALGITGVSLRDYILGFVGMIPGTILYVYLGSLAGSLAAIGPSTQPPSTVQWIIRIMGLLATVAVTLFVTRIARNTLTTAIPDSAESAP